MNAAELVRSSEFWFKDGTVVLQIENTLYRSLLSSRSTVFHDIPQPPRLTEKSGTKSRPTL
ncbi:hypothetical protein DFH09DRAFT_1124218 [Mycena vulgaris]|nr:hypothetical protein DFH09DRAFT_1124218 [Mycena vulgaris]